MAIEAIGAVLEKDSTTVGEVVNIVLPADESKEYEITNLSDIREQFRQSAMSVKQEFTATIRLQVNSPVLVKGDSGSFSVILPLENPSSTTNAQFDFDGYIRLKSAPTLDVGATEGITEDYTITLTSEVTFTPES